MKNAMTDRIPPALWLWLLFAAAKVLIHAMVGNGYGYFRDEFYYIACSDHLAWGFVDQPPLSIALLKLSRVLFGDSIPALHVFPTLAGAATVVVVGWTARALGGGLMAQALAMAATLAAPEYLGTNGVYTMNSFDLLLWAVALAILTRIFLGGSQRWWIGLGVVMGLGLLNKISMLWFGAGLAAGLVLTHHRALLRTRGPYLAAGIAALLFLPHVIWQIAHGWPTLEFMRNATADKMVAVSPLEFLSRQTLSMSPASLLVWLPGLVWLLARREVRALGILFLAVTALLIVNGTSRAGYLAPAFTILFAAGGVALDTLRSRRWLAWLRPAVAVVVLAAGAMLAPFALPILPIPTYIAYAQRLGITPSTDEHLELAQLPQHFADRCGWEAIVRQVAHVYEALPPEDRAVAGIYVNNYGDGGAIDLLGRKYGLPLATSGHNNYWLWGTRGYSGEVMILLGGNREDHLRSFEQVEAAGETDCGYCMPYENHRTIWVARHLRAPLAEIWPHVKHFE